MRSMLCAFALLIGGIALVGCVDDELRSVSSALGGECSSRKTLMCHVPPGHPANAHSLCISSAAVAAHEAHGDYPGACHGGTCTAEGEPCSLDDDCCDGTCNGDGVCGPDAPVCAPEGGACQSPADCCVDPFGFPMGCDATVGCFRQS